MSNWSNYRWAPEEFRSRPTTSSLAITGDREPNAEAIKAALAAVRDVDTWAEQVVPSLRADRRKVPREPVVQKKPAFAARRQAVWLILAATAGAVAGWWTSVHLPVEPAPDAGSQPASPDLERDVGLHLDTDFETLGHRAAAADFPQDSNLRLVNPSASQ